MNSPLRKISFILIAGFMGMQSFGKPGPVHHKLLNTKKDGWRSLFDGKSLSGWHAFNKNGAIKSWTVIEGALACFGASADTKDDIVTDKEYANFELSWSWKIDKGSNSGVLYHVVEDPKYHTTYETGPEYQLIDDNGYPEKLEDWQKTGADYAMHLANDQKKVTRLANGTPVKLFLTMAMWSIGSTAKRYWSLKPGATTGIRKKRQVNGKIIQLTAWQKPGTSFYRTMGIRFILKRLR